jgi:hypothetical protein
MKIRAFQGSDKNGAQSAANSVRDNSNFSTARSSENNNNNNTKQNSEKFGGAR